MRALPLLLLTLACAACTQRDAGHDTVATPNTTAPAATAAPPPAIATTTPPPAATTVAAPGGVMPAAGAISFAGFGPAHWGASEEQVRQAWGKDMEDLPKEHDGCYYLFPEPRREAGYRFAFMMEGGKFDRIDVRTPDIAAPGGGKVGSDKTALLRLYPKGEEQPHKYVEGGKNLRIADPAGGAGVLIFELDPAGKATAWRVGVPPQVDYVEGCS